MTRSTCFICGEEVRRQLGFNPAALTNRNKQILKSLRSSWTKSLCILLGVTEGTTRPIRTLLQTVPYCLSCHELISNVDFMITTIARLEGKIHSVKQRVKVLLNHSYKVNSTHRQLISQVLSLDPGKGTMIGKDNPVEIPTEATESALCNKTDPENGLYDASCASEVNPEFILIPNFAEDDDNGMLDPSEDCQMSDDNDDPSWKPEMGDQSDRMRKSIGNSMSTVKHALSNQPNRIRKPKVISKASTCPICAKFMFGERERRRHMKQVHPPMSGDNSLKCQFCGKCHSSIEELEAHEVLHAPTAGNPFSCVLCQSEMTSVYDLQRHVMREHETGVFKCDECAQVFTTELNLYLHKKRTHLLGVDKSKMHQCPQCPFQALYPSILKYHLQTHGERSFKCEVDGCFKMFFRRSTLKSHQRRVHGTETKCYRCALCTKTFGTQSLLKGHQIHHSTVRPFMCEMCSATFKSDRNLATHTKVHDKVSGTNIKLQRPRRPRLSDIRLQDNTKPPNVHENPYRGPEFQHFSGCLSE